MLHYAALQNHLAQHDNILDACEPGERDSIRRDLDSARNAIVKKKSRQRWRDGNHPKSQVKLNTSYESPSRTNHGIL